MAAILDQHQSPAAAAAAWLRANPATRAAWLVGVRRFDGRPALENAHAGAELTDRQGFEEWMMPAQDPDRGHGRGG